MCMRVLGPVLLLALALPGQEPAAERPDYAALERQYQEAQQEWSTALRAASQAKDQEALKKLIAERPEARFVPRFEAAAKALAGSKDAVPFLAWIVSRGEGESAKAAMTTLMKDHVTDPGIKPAVARLGGLHQRFGLEQTRAWLDAVLARNEDPEVQAQARFTRAALYVGTRAAARSEELRLGAILDLEHVLEHSGSKSLQGLAKGLLYEAQTLEPGLPAPEIEGEDLDGVPFKLSDYRGKVVMLDFWGDW